MQKKPRLHIVQEDITQMKVDAIVNTANSSLLGGGGVDGAIHRAAGPGLLEACRKLNGCQTGQAKTTPGFDLDARFVIHTVGPIWNGGRDEEDELLMQCYQHALQLAVEHQCQSIAFPAISTGAYGFPMERATRIALETSIAFQAEHSESPEIYFVCFNEESFRIYEKGLREVFGTGR